jgi:AraC-like DNA-binding protein
MRTTNPPDFILEHQPEAWPPPFRLPYVRWANIIHFPASDGNPLHLQPDHQLVFILAGQGNLIIQGQSHPATPDHLFFITPRSWYEMRAAPDQPLSILNVHFDWISAPDSPELTYYYNVHEAGTRFREPLVFPGWEMNDNDALDVRGKPEIRFLMEQIVAAFRRSDEYSPWETGALLVAVISQVARVAQFLHETRKKTSISLQSAYSVESAYRTLETTSEHVDFTKLARNMGWSPDHLRRMLRLVFGQSPSQIQAAGRIRRAKELLSYGKLPIHKIGTQCGFSDSSHFARVFKREEGLTPRQFRALSRQDIKF